MLVACLRMCVCAFEWTIIYREETQERSANVGKWAGSSRQLSFACSHTNACLFVIKVFVLEGDHIFIEEVVHFTLIYIAH